MRLLYIVERRIGDGDWKPLPTAFVTRRGAERRAENARWGGVETRVAEYAELPPGTAFSATAQDDQRDRFIRTLPAGIVVSPTVEVGRRNG